jgi:Na+-driven multidrug efflux pump
MSISSPLITIIASSPFFLAGGATVVFTQAMGKKNRYKANEIFKTSFWMVICLAILEIIILLSINKPVLTAMSPKSETTTDPILQDFFNQEHALQIKFAREYTLIYSIGIFLPLLMFYFASLVKSEGRFRLVVITSIVCNVLNIGCIIFFILVAKIDMYGGALGSTISYTINLTTILVYIGFLNKKNDT